MPGLTMDLFGMEPAPQGAAADDAPPLIERYGQGWICRDRRTREIIPNFEGVAYCEELECFVHTFKSGHDRGIWELGSKTYEGAAAESADLQRQMPLDM